MADIQIHTANGWVNLNDIIIAKAECFECGAIEDAEGEGFISIDPVAFQCRKCRERHTVECSKCTLDVPPINGRFVKSEPTNPIFICDHCL